MTDLIKLIINTNLTKNHFNVTEIFFVTNTYLEEK